MRKFTKEHNKLLWLFSICETEEAASKMFDNVEETAVYYFENACYKDDDTFNKDDMIDSFMKGYSVATQLLSQQIQQLNFIYKSQEELLI